MTRFPNVSPAFAPLALAALLLSACASVVTPPPAATVPSPSPSTTSPSISTTSPTTSLSFSSLNGWADEDHLAALNAFRSGCGIAKDQA